MKKKGKKDIFSRTIHRGKLQFIKRQICIRYEGRRGLSFYPAAYQLLSDTQFLVNSATMEAKLSVRGAWA